jgi:hypothetical protein
MGGSKSSQKETTNVTTTTTTKMGDVGLTGKNAVDLAAILESGAVQRTMITGDVLKNLIQATGQGFEQVVGGASDMVESAKEIQAVQSDQGPAMDKMMKMSFVAVGAFALVVLYKK